jgi:hypothetical protein
MTTHDQFLELAAAAIDFELSPSERAALDSHLAECVTCRRRIAGLEADQRGIRQLPAYELAPATTARIRGHVLSRQRPQRSGMRLLAIAALLAVLAVASIAVGSALLRRDRSDLTVVQPSLPPLELPEEEPALLPVNSLADVIVPDLRVRTEPTVDDTKSAKLEPLLGRGTQLRILEGPVTADDYDWYRVEAIGWPHRGWVAAADHDGVPWIRSETAVATAASTFAPAEAALIAGLRPDAAIDCAPRRTRLPTRALTGVECRVNAAVVKRIGLYGFRDDRDAALTYLERLASYGVSPATGDCSARTEGDRAWRTGDGKAGPDRLFFDKSGPWVVGRIGCFHDENGKANVRVTCGPTYVGILGRDDDLADVERWAWSSPAGLVAAGDPPGICPAGR